MQVNFSVVAAEALRFLELIAGATVVVVVVVVVVSVVVGV